MDSKFIPNTPSGYKQLPLVTLLLFLIFSNIIGQVCLSITYLTFKNAVCTKENGFMLTTNNFKYCTKVAHYELGLDKFDYHSLRHTHATILVENGASIKDVQERLGHTDIATTMNMYVHNTNKIKKV